ncbi:hypothetical protein BJX68DRAFT_179643 [Aspergillus pseudodeflectus]|uniref:Uncharacterized protein n=1 Tax=Aspergillus pseudodeflectus TaxID=176178 RepID=A0ABR4L2E4_9EURO
MEEADRHRQGNDPRERKAAQPGGSGTAAVWHCLPFSRTSVAESDTRYRQLLLDADEFVKRHELDKIRGETRAGAVLS